MERTDVIFNFQILKYMYKTLRCLTVEGELTEISDFFLSPGLDIRRHFLPMNSDKHGRE